MKIQSKKELQKIAQENFLKIYKDYTSESYSCMIIDRTVPTGDSMRFRKNF